MRVTACILLLKTGSPCWDLRPLGSVFLSEVSLVEGRGLWQGAPLLALALPPGVAVGGEAMSASWLTWATTGQLAAEPTSVAPPRPPMAARSGQLAADPLVDRPCPGAAYGSSRRGEKGSAPLAYYLFCTHCWHTAICIKKKLIFFSAFLHSFSFFFLRCKTFSSSKL